MWSRTSYRSLWDKSSALEAFLEISACLVPLWVAVLVGLVVGWMWKPKWVSLLFLGVKSRPRLLWTTPPGFGARRIWLAITAFTAFQMLKDFTAKVKLQKRPKIQLAHSTEKRDAIGSRDILKKDDSPGLPNLASSVVGDEDLKDLKRRLDYKDGGLPWELLMERSTSNLTYKAWRRDPQGGPTEYRSRTVFEDVSPALVKDFYWDDEFRSVWDELIVYTKPLEECPMTGSEIVHWVRKFPLFCSNREYTIGRRIFESGDTYFCITKTVPYSAIAKNSSNFRVTVYFSSWCIRAVESPKNQGQMTACEVTFFHAEDMGIPRELAKFAIRQGMWTCVRKMEPGIRKYKVSRMASKSLSHSVRMAQIITKVPISILEDSCAVVLNEAPVMTESRNSHHANGWKWLIVGGAVILACGLDRGIVSKVLVFGVARRLSKLGRRL